eukprot:scpid35783/ scgid28305/ 
MIGGLGLPGMMPLWTALPLKSLAFHYPSFAPITAADFCCVRQYQKASLEVLGLSFPRITNAFVRSILSTLGYCRQLISLFLSGCTVSADTLLALAMLLAKLPKLSLLSLTRNDFRDAGGKADLFAISVACCSLKVLRMPVEALVAVQLREALNTICRADLSVQYCDEGSMLNTQ